MRLLRGPDSVAITNVAAYPGAFTTAIVVSCLHEAGCIRVNLDAQPWRSPNHRETFVNAWKAPVWLGDPVAYGAMESLEIDHAPSVILSCILHLSDTYAERLRQRYGCPVIDLYAMTEAGIIAAGVGHGHQVLAPDLWVEILDENGEPVPPGTRGEITLTGGRNPFLPLLRYRTGDFASLDCTDGKRVLVGLEGRHPTEYRSSTGRMIHSMEVTRLVRRHPIQRYAMENMDDGRYRLRVRGDVDPRQFEREVVELFGTAATIEYE